MNRKKLEKLVLAGTAAYFAVASALVLKDLACFYRQNSKCRNVNSGKERFAKKDVLRCKIYSEEEISASPELSNVELYFLPYGGNEIKPYILFLPGGAYLECDLKKVSLPSAARANELGYNAFALKYRVRKHTEDYAPVRDVARAIEYITKHIDELNICSEDYMITGFSAGGNLAGLFASKDVGYEKYSLPKPSCLTLVYPWTNMSDKVKLTGNIERDGIKFAAKKAAEKVMLGGDVSAIRENELNLENHIDETYPPCIIFHGDSDTFASSEGNSEKFAEKLRDNGVHCELIVFSGLTHGFGVGEGTEAENWMEKSIEFWRRTKEEK